MTIPYPTDPSLPANPSPLFSDSTAARGDHLRANNAEIWANFVYIVNTILGGAVLSTDGTFASNSDLLFPSEKAILTYINSLIPVGTSMEYSGITIPSMWMKEDGSSLLRESYPTLFTNLSSVFGTITITIASPGVVTSSSHPLITGDCIHLTTTGALPTGLTASTNYYVIYKDANSFWLATTLANAIAGTKINTSGSQSGTHTLTWIPWGAADSTHLYLPDTQGLSTEGSGTGSSAPAYNPWLSANYAGRLGQYKQDQMQQITGQLRGTNGDGNAGNFITASGAFSLSDLTIGHGGTAMGSGFARQSSFDSANSPNARTGLTTIGPRVGKWKMIKVL